MKLKAGDGDPVRVGRASLEPLAQLLRASDTDEDAAKDLEAAYARLCVRSQRRAAAPPLARFGDALRRSQDERSSSIDLAIAARKVNATTRSTRPAVVGWTRPVLGGAFSMATMALVVLAVRGHQTAPTAQAQLAATPVVRTADPKAGEVIVETASFADGTKLSLEPRSRAVVIAVTPDGARLRLEEGTMHVAVVHHPTSNWHFVGGAFDVLVTGTKFDMSWSAGENHFRVAMHEGSVRITGPEFPGGRAVVAGETMDVVGAQVMISGQGLAAAAPSVDGEPVSPRARPSGRHIARKLDARSPVASSPLHAPESWRSLARAFDYAGAMAAAEATGFAAEAAHASVKDLALLGDTARLAGNEARAIEAYTLLRKRFPTDARAAEAAFLLGKFAFDAHADDARAAAWFERCIREQPQGVLARDALGRLMEARKRMGDGAKAIEAARLYIDMFPAGPRIALARSIAFEPP